MLPTQETWWGRRRGTGDLPITRSWALADPPVVGAGGLEVEGGSRSVSLRWAGLQGQAARHFPRGSPVSSLANVASAGHACPVTRLRQLSPLVSEALGLCCDGG